MSDYLDGYTVDNMQPFAPYRIVIPHRYYDRQIVNVGTLADALRIVRTHSQWVTALRFDPDCTCGTQRGGYHRFLTYAEQKAMREQ